MLTSLKSIVFLLVIAFFLYAAFVAFLYGYQRNLIYFPHLQPVDPALFSLSQDIQITVQTKDSLTLHAWYFPPAGKDKVIIYFHGNASSYTNTYPKILPYLEAGYGMLLAEYRGYGGNMGVPHELGLYQDADSYINFLIQNQRINIQNIVLYGESLGSAVAVRMAEIYQNVSGVILEAPFTSALDVARERYFFVPLDWLMLDQYRSDLRVRSLKAPFLVMHGKKDTVVPFVHGKRLYDMADMDRKYFVEFPKSGHNDLYDHGAALQVLKFLSSIDSGP